MTKNIDIILFTAIEELRTSCIGLFQVAKQDYEFIIEIDEHSITTIRVGNLLGISTCHYPKDKFMYATFLFPDNKTFKQMLDSPLEFHDWMKKNKLD